MDVEPNFCMMPLIIQDTRNPQELLRICFQIQNSALLESSCITIRLCFFPRKQLAPEGREQIFEYWFISLLFCHLLTARAWAQHFISGLGGLSYCHTQTLDHKAGTQLIKEPQDPSPLAIRGSWQNPFALGSPDPQLNTGWAPSQQPGCSPIPIPHCL